MKEYMFLFALVATLTVSCNSSDDDTVVTPSPKSNSNVISLRSAGMKLPGDVSYDASYCNPEGSEQTLRSIRYVDPLPIYYMDYYAKVDWDKLEKDPSVI